MLKMARMYDYQLGVDFVKRRLSYTSNFNTGKKLSLGLLYGYKDWVSWALHDLYVTGGLKIEDSWNGEPYKFCFSLLA